MTSPALFSELPSDRKLIETHLTTLLMRGGSARSDAGPAAEAMRYAVLGVCRR